MSDGHSTEKKPTVARRLARSGLYLIPGYPLVKAAASMKDTVSTGLQTITDQNRELAAQRRNPRLRTFNEALARRSAESSPVSESSLNRCRTTSTSSGKSPAGPKIFGKKSGGKRPSITLQSVTVSGPPRR